jgi:hypothetical protein
MRESAAAGRVVPSGPVMVTMEDARAEVAGALPVENVTGGCCP